jgi:hypothetical protein
MEVLCDFSKMIILVCIIEDQAGQLGESRFEIQSSEVVAPAYVD